MLLTVEPDGPIPIYQQIRDRIVEAIASGQQPARSALPSTRRLAVDLGVLRVHAVPRRFPQRHPTASIQVDVLSELWVVHDLTR